MEPDPDFVAEDEAAMQASAFRKAPTPPIEPEAEPLCDWTHVPTSVCTCDECFMPDDLIALRRGDHYKERCAHWHGKYIAAEVTIDRLSRERDEALRVAARGVSFKGDAQDTLRWMNRALTAERQVEQLSRVVEAARELDIQPCDFAGAEPKPGLRRWCLTHGEYDRGAGCPGGNLLAALSDYDKGRGECKVDKAPTA